MLNAIASLFRLARAGIVLDQCYKQTYTPLETAAAAKKP